MEYDQISDKIERHYQNQLPFVVYATPESDTLNAIFTKEGSDHNSSAMSSNGFVMAPFYHGESLFISLEESDTYSAVIPINIEASERVDLDQNSTEETKYKKLVLDAINRIATTEMEKIVTSRKLLQLLKFFSLSKVLDRLMQLYPTAFRYIWYHPKSGLWVGATPEVLLSIKEGQFVTMALAGTQEYQEGRTPEWTEKEIAEQQWVVDDISQRLQPIANVINISKIRDHRAGNLVHLRTDFSGTLKKGSNQIGDLCRLLHPTPAICGTPREAALSFILENENYDRSYYTGFLGPIGISSNQSHCYVNLRCMKLEAEHATIYVGGGVTEGSIPKTEWEETESKLQTMLNVLAPLL